MEIQEPKNPAACALRIVLPSFSTLNGGAGDARQMQGKYHAERESLFVDRAESIGVRRGPIDGRRGLGAGARDLE